MEPSSLRSSLRRLAVYGGAYAVWLAASALGGLDIFLLRSAFDQIYILFQFSTTAYHFIDRAILLVLGAAWLFLMMLGEGYFVGAVEKGLLRQRTVKVFAILGSAAVVLYVVPLLLTALKAM
jgi:hypothetical protein